MRQLECAMLIDPILIPLSLENSKKTKNLVFWGLLCIILASKIQIVQAVPVLI